MPKKSNAVDAAAMKYPRKVIRSRTLKREMMVDLECGHNYISAGCKRKVPTEVDCPKCAEPLSSRRTHDSRDLSARDLIIRRLYEIGARELAPWRELVRIGTELFSRFPAVELALTPETRKPLRDAWECWMQTSYTAPDPGTVYESEAARTARQEAALAEYERRTKDKE